MGSTLWTEEQFNCPVCLDLPNDPVTIPCGHSYCMACIKDYWSKDDPNGIYSCPQCRQTFCPKPSLSRNTMLTEAVEQLRKGANTSTVRDSIRNARMSMVSLFRSKGTAKLSSSAVPCNMCHGEPQAAVKSCLVCMSSYCETHLKPHQTQTALMQHELIAPTGNLSEKICTQHKYLQEFVCRDCKIFVCWICTSNQHKGHECVSTKTERLEKQKVLAEIQTENQQKLKDREQELKDMKTMMEVVKHSTGRVQEDIEQVLSDLQRSVERLQELLEEVLEEASLDKMNQAQDVTENLEAEIKELKKRDTEMKDLVRCEDHIHYLQTYESMCSPLESGDLPSVAVNQDASFEPVRDAILNLRDKVEDLCNLELSKITKQVKETTLFSLGDANRNNQKGGFLKLFSGLSSRTSNSRSPASIPSISVGSRSTDRRVLGIGNRSQDVRSRDTPRDRGNSSSSPRPRERGRRDDTETVRDTSPRPSRSPAPSHSESPSLWNRSNQSLAVPEATLSPVPANPAPAPASTPSAAPGSAGGFSRMASINSSISSVFRSHRRSATPSTPGSNTPSAGGDPGAMAALSETPAEGFSRMASINSSISSVFRSHRRSATPSTPATPSAGGDPGAMAALSETPAEGFSRMASINSSISSVFRSHRRSAKPSTPGSNAPSAGEDPWAMAALSETEVNPSLFLDLPSTDAANPPAFPALREINIDSIQAPEPRTREEFLQYSVPLSLDPNSAHKRLVLSEDNTKATLQVAAQPYPDTPQRFECWTQVMCQSPLGCQRCYWEVEWRGRGSSMGVAYGSLNRKCSDGRAGLGYNAQSWTLELSDTCCSAMYDNNKKDIPVTYSPRVGVYVDLSVGTLAFYSVADNMTHLHTFRANFTRPLYAAFGVGSGIGVGLDFALGQFSSSADSIKICHM